MRCGWTGATDPSKHGCMVRRLNAETDYDLSIIIPVYNEEKRICSCLNSLCAFVSGSGMKTEVVVSEDGSTDRTVDIVYAYMREFPFIRLVHSDRRLGKGGGIREGIFASKGKFILYMDVDLAVKPTEIPRLLDGLMHGFDIVIGSRELSDSKLIRRQPFYREFLGKSYNRIFRLLFRIPIYDTQCGFKALKREVAIDLMEHVSTNGFSFDTDLIVRAVKNYKILEIPVTWAHGSMSKVRTFNQILTMLCELLRLWFEEKAHPTNIEHELEIRFFYDALPGNAYFEASKSAFAPRRIWHLHKNLRVVRAVLRYHIGKQSSLLLDAGCGSGTLLESFAKKGLPAVGLDLGLGFIQWTHSRMKSLNYPVMCIRGDIRSLPIRDNTLTSVICSEVLEHVKYPTRALSEFRRVLSRDGLVVITTPNQGLLWSIVEALWVRIRKRKLETHHLSFRVDRLETILRQQGFEILSSIRINLRCLVLVVARRLLS